MATLWDMLLFAIFALSIIFVATVAVFFTYRQARKNPSAAHSFIHSIAAFTSTTRTLINASTPSVSFAQSAAAAPVRSHRQR
jgi:uncharacterized protein YpmS